MLTAKQKITSIIDNEQYQIFKIGKSSNAFPLADLFLDAVSGHVVLVNGGLLDVITKQNNNQVNDNNRDEVIKSVKSALASQGFSSEDIQNLEKFYSQKPLYTLKGVMSIFLQDLLQDQQTKEDWGLKDKTKDGRTCTVDLVKQQKQPAKLVINYPNVVIVSAKNDFVENCSLVLPIKVTFTYVFNQEGVLLDDITWQDDGFNTSVKFNREKSSLIIEGPCKTNKIFNNFINVVTSQEMPEPNVVYDFSNKLIECVKVSLNKTLKTLEGNLKQVTKSEQERLVIQDQIKICNARKLFIEQVVTREDLIGKVNSYLLNRGASTASKYKGLKFFGVLKEAVGCYTKEEKIIAAQVLIHFLMEQPLPQALEEYLSNGSNRKRIFGALTQGNSDLQVVTADVNTHLGSMGKPKLNQETFGKYTQKTTTSTLKN